MIKLIISDYKKYKIYGGNFFSVVFFTQGFSAIFQYRVAHQIYNRVKLPILRHFLILICNFWQKWIEISTGISIPKSALIGNSFYIGHFGGIFLNSSTVIGNNCNISQGVTIGISGTNEKRGVPIIGNNVYIGVNSVIAGKIVIGSNVLIGSCSLVIADVKDNSVMSGVPAIVISNNGSKGYL